MEENILRVNKVSRSFPIAGSPPFWALKEVDMTIPKASLTILKGRSGSGKTTLLNILSGLDYPTSGEVWFEEKDIVKLPESDREEMRRYHMGYVFQSVALIPIMSAYENVEFALRLGKYEGDFKERVELCLQKVGLKDRMYHMPREMSGGEQQRVAIARALAHQPKIIFADEPTAELDTHTGLQVVKVFKDLIEEEQVSIVITTHDSGLMDIGDLCYEMEDGELVRER